MCGIYCCYGKNNAAQKAFNGLKKLEYRGYDSWGISYASKCAPTLTTVKQVGAISHAKLSFSKNADAAIAHTRWATHGKVTKANAHPQVSADKKFSIVHNGIVENHQDLVTKYFPKKQFVSQTDTEVILKLINKQFQAGFTLEEAVSYAANQLVGLNAFACISQNTQEIIAVTTGSPLVIGWDINSNIHLSSDADAFPSTVEKITYLTHNCIVKLSSTGVEIFDLNLTPINFKKQPAIKSTLTVTKGNYPHYFLKEVHDQLALIKLYQHLQINFQILELVRKFSVINFIGCGSAYHAALVGEYLFSPLNKNCHAYMGSEIFNFLDFDKKKLNLFLTQSGETIDIVEPLKKLTLKGLKTAALVNRSDSTVHRLATASQLIEAGPEIAVVSTKAFTAKLLSLLAIKAHFLNETTQFIGQLEKLTSQLNTIFSDQYQSQYLQPVVAKLLQARSSFILGRGLSYPIALEFALKIKESAYLHAEAFAAGELKHGVLALITKETPCLILAPKNEHYRAVISNAQEIKARGGYTIGISSQAHSAFDMFIPVSDTQLTTIISHTIIGQLLAYYSSIRQGLNPDKPRNLAKSVTVK